MPQTDSTALAATLLAHRHAFRGFLTARLGNEAEAEDLLQNGLVKALQRADEVRDQERAVAWFYRLLRNSLVDHVRSRSATRQRESAWAADAQALAEPEEVERHVCACFEALLPSLKAVHAELLRRVELEGESVAHAAAATGITPNHASVTLHRARAELRSKLIAFCGSCADGACLDCDCDAPTPPKK